MIRYSLIACSLATAFLSGCGATPGPTETATPAHRLDTIGISAGDVGDATTTAAGLWSDVAHEANPALAPFGDAVPLVLIPVKLGTKHALTKIGKRPAEANLAVNAGGIFATCSNIATLASMAAPPAIALGAFCGVVYYDIARDDYREKTGINPNGTPVR